MRSIIWSWFSIRKAQHEKHILQINYQVDSEYIFTVSFYTEGHKINQEIITLHEVNETHIFLLKFEMTYQPHGFLKENYLKTIFYWKHNLLHRRFW